jgi:hypothetical protein
MTALQNKSLNSFERLEINIFGAALAYIYFAGPARGSYIRPLLQS